MIRRARIRQHIDDALIASQDQRIRELAAENRVLWALLAEVTEPCTPNDAGYCAAHGWFRAARPCPHARARAALGPVDAIKEPA